MVYQQKLTSELQNFQVLGMLWTFEVFKRKTWGWEKPLQIWRNFVHLLSTRTCTFSAFTTIGSNCLMYELRIVLSGPILPTVRNFSTLVYSETPENIIKSDTEGEQCIIKWKPCAGGRRSSWSMRLNGPFVGKAQRSEWQVDISFHRVVLNQNAFRTGCLVVPKCGQIDSEQCFEQLESNVLLVG